MITFPLTSVLLTLGIAAPAPLPVAPCPRVQEALTMGEVEDIPSMVPS